MSDLYARSWLILRAFWGQFRELTPLWLAGMVVGASLSWALRPRLSRGAAWPALRFGGAPLQLLAGALIGVVSPFSLLSLAGLIRELLRDRRAAPFALGLALANPLLNPSILMFTWLALGPRFALWRIGATLAAALLGGAILLRLPGGAPAAEAQCSDTGAPPAPRTWGAFLRHMAHEIVVYGRYYLLALILAAWLDAFAPLRGLWVWLGRAGGLAAPLAALAGGPFYLCGGGAVALARELLAQGLSAGPALAFLTFGPAVTIRALAGMTAIGGRRMTAVFVGSALTTALAVGYLAR